MRRVRRLGPGAGAALALLFLWGCGRYADFTLPVLSGGDPHAYYRWEPAAEPVLPAGATWDSHDALNPSVTGSVPLFNFYSGFDGRTWRTGLATSADGLHWQKRGMVLAPDPDSWEGSYIAANGAAWFDGSEYRYWYQAGPRGGFRIGLASSKDGRTWRKHPEPVLGQGPRGAWDERAVADPYIFRVPPYLYLYYLGQDRAAQQRLGVARSRDGVHWEKLRSNPILEPGGGGEFDEKGLGEPAVWAARGFYWMLYTGRDVHENRRLGLARSTDGVHWSKLAGVFSGSQAWNSKVVCDPTVIAGDSEVKVWFGGGDVASPDENLNGQIGFGVLRPANDTLAK
ncbi:MAG TPA: hypothetical protein VKV17_07080 [Bryobacteraceae bacterium]|nr:hypothetical protein [Bryobacteraceae bacterium]